MMTKFKLNFDKICQYCNRKIRWYHKIDFTLTDIETNRLIRKDTPAEILETKTVDVDLFHAKCLKVLVNEATNRLTDYMKEKKFVRDEDLR